MSERADLHPLLAALKCIMPSLAKALGDDAEIVLHELSHPEDSVISVEGSVTKRKVGAPLTDLVLCLLRQERLQEDLINYDNRTADGKVLRSSTIFIRDENGEVIGCLCINFDITRWMVAKHVIDSFCQREPIGGAPRETFTQDVESMLRLNMEEVIKRAGVPVALMKKDDKLSVVKGLDEQGVFLIKGAVASVARVLDVSRYTIYNYLEEIRGESSEVPLINP